MNNDLLLLKYWTSLLQRLVDSFDEQGVGDSRLLAECTEALEGTLAAPDAEPASENESGNPEATNSPVPVLVLQVKSIVRRLLKVTLSTSDGPSDLNSQKSQ